MGNVVALEESGHWSRGLADGNLAADQAAQVLAAFHSKGINEIPS
jgi:hypothetical protein